MEHPNKPPPLSSQLRAASSLLSPPHHPAVSVEPEHFRLPHGNTQTLSYQISFPPGYFNAYKGIERLQSLVKKNCPLLVQDEFRFYSDHAAQAHFEIDYILYEPLTVSERQFLEDTKKLFSHNAIISIIIH